jgi:uncharacterized protein YndB with AHSA1/START domain
MAMTLHANLVFERDVPAPIEQVFAAFADPALRSEWGAPSETAVIIYDEADFREGGQDRFRCGPKANSRAVAAAAQSCYGLCKPRSRARCAPLS